jgi:hypothetical protein
MRWLLVVLLFLCMSCHKVVDYYELDGKKKLPPCRLIKEMYQEGVNYYQYDENGNPVRVVDLPSSESGSPTYEESFSYDESGRLSAHDVYSYFYDSWTYVYEGDSRLPARDSLVDWAGRQYVEEFKYDNAGRIIEVKKEFVRAPDDYPWDLWGDPAAENHTQKFFYDIRGNMHTLPWYNSYSDKPSLNSLHPTWQLVRRNFSKNANQYSPGTIFNNQGLPVEFPDGNKNEYECED